MQQVSEGHYLFARMQGITYLKTVNLVPTVSLHGACKKGQIYLYLICEMLGLKKQHECIPTRVSVTCCNLQCIHKIMQCCWCSFVFE